MTVAMKSPDKKLPRILIWLVNWMYQFSLREGYYGDMREEYFYLLEKEGPIYAYWWIICQIVRSIPGLITSYIRWSITMIMNYIKIAFRNFSKYKIHSIVNIAGLAVGMAVVMLIMLFVIHEKEFDTFHKNHERIFRVVADDPSTKDSYAGTPAPLGPAMLREFPDIENYVRVENTTEVVKYKNKSFRESRVFMADNSLFQIFTFPLIQGDPETVLENPNEIILTKSMVEKYFGSEDPLGKIMRLGEREDFIVTAIAEDVPWNSHFHFDFLIPFKRIKNLENWGTWNYYTYILLHENVNPENLKSKFDEWAKSQNLDDLYAEVLYYQPLTQIHFQYNRYNIEPSFNGKYINIFIAIAVVILILACINFINLTTARATRRAKEVGIKKSIGVLPSQLMTQFIGESFLLALIAHIFSVLLVLLALPAFNNFTERNLALDFTNYQFVAVLAGLIIFTGILSGSYPAIILSSFNPVKVLKGEVYDKTRSVLRNGLVIFQFVISITLIICTMLIYGQMKYINNVDLGLNKERVVTVRLNRNVYSKAVELKQAFLQLPGIIAASANSYIPSNMNWHQSVWWRGQLESEHTSMWVIGIDKDFPSTMQIELFEGHDAVANFKYSKRDAYILNKSALEQIGWNSAVGKEFSIMGEERAGIVIGVTEDFHFRSLHHEVAPCAMLVRERMRQISVRFQSDNLPNTLANLKKTWRKFAPDYEFEYYFLDDDFDKLYKSDMKLSQLIIAFTTLSIFIACLGLFSLVSFAAAQKTKEIGIRKVLGASSFGVSIWLARNFVKLVFFANVIAWPAAYFVMNEWLKNFAYRVAVGISPFIISSIFAILIAFLTVYYQTFKASLANPVDSLEYE